MQIVIDTSVVIAVIVNEPTKERLIQLTDGADMIAPRSIHWEIGNAFSAMMKRKRITEAQVLKAVKSYKYIPVQFVDIRIEDSLRIAHQLNIYAYDAYIICCAHNIRAPLLTLDKGLKYAAREYGIKVLEV
ncbi:MAG: type II toxin-antitoxin system VapC family toxin [Candidatus Aminicenantes bacterium]|nr:type II toxin-antitoxin system VapC family toxin [Candidatus Aminicenantes bacterium]